MVEYLFLYEESEQGLNTAIMNRENDKPIVEYIANICKSLEILNNIEFLGYTYENDESKVDISPYIKARKRDDDEEDIKYQNLQDTRYGELTLRFRLRCKDGVDNNFIKTILIPKVDKNGYMTIRGKKYFLLYQLVDKSTYTTLNEVVNRSLIAVIISRDMKEVTDINGVAYKAPTYNIKLFNKRIDIFNIFFAKMGVHKTLSFFSCSSLIKIIDTIDNIDEEQFIYFKINSSLYIQVVRPIFEKYQYLRTVVFMIIVTCNNRVKIDMLEDKIEWTNKLGALTTTSQYKTFQKGKNLLTVFERMVDRTTIDSLKLHDENNGNVFNIVRWMIQDYNALRMKSNVDLGNKRLRLNEYIASILNIEFNNRLRKLLRESGSITLYQIGNLFKFPGDILVQNLHSSGLLRYDDAMNDNDFFTKLKYTIKGPNSVGGKNERSIEMSLRGIHQSHLGRVDINVCSASAPGTGGVITPYSTDISGLYFDDSNEPEEGRYEFEKGVDEVFREIDPDNTVSIMCDDSDEYYDTLDRMNETIRNTKLYDIYITEDYEFINIKVDHTSMI